MTSNASRLVGVTEHRSLAVSDFELRSEGDALVLDGYASVFDSPYEVNGWVEVVDRGAFDVTLSKNPDVQLLVNHEGTPLARTARAGKPGTMTLSTDKQGLRVNAQLERRDPDVERIEPKLRRGDLDEMSFAFRTVRQEWNEAETERHLLEVNIHKGDVSVVNYGANDATTVQLRSFADAVAFLGNVDPEQALVELRSLEDPWAAISDARRTLGDLVTALAPRRLSVADAETLLSTPR